MKICAIICEYNPFHNGHLRQIREIKRILDSPYILCIMSGNFVQRGESSVLEKHVRARHAVLAGADAVIELPTPFATSNAELFASGAVHILSSIPAVDYLCFGAENAEKQEFLKAAALLNDEPKSVSDTIKRLTSEGVSYAKARANAWGEILSKELLNSPNNVLGLEYTKAILKEKANIEILPIPRVGGGYKDDELSQAFPSATAIRAAIGKKRITTEAPAFVVEDLPNSLEDGLETLEKYAILRTPAKEIARVCDCTEGLENAFKKAATQKESLTSALTSARYTSSRIRRIALQNLLRIDEDLIRSCLRAPLYLRALAVNKQKRELLSILSQSDFPLLLRAHDEEFLSPEAKACFERDLFAERVYELLYPQETKQDIWI